MPWSETPRYEGSFCYSLLSARRVEKGADVAKHHRKDAALGERQQAVSGVAAEAVRVLLIIEAYVLTP